jgi:hypothetical protein
MGILGAPDVDWTITLDGGRVDVAAGSVVRATIGFRPLGSITPRRVMAALVGTEDYRYREREMRSSGTSSDLEWGSDDVHRQEVQLLGPGPIGAGEARSGPVEFTLPADALPSLDADILKMRWRIVAWMDVGGRDPKTEQQLIVPLRVAQLNPADAAGLGQQVQTAIDGQPVTFWANPAPLVAGQPFSGALDVTTPFPAADSHVELKLNVSTQMGGGIAGATLLALAGFTSTSQSGVNSSQVLWRGPLTDGGPVGAWHRYAFGGQLPLAPIVTAVYPHGVATAQIDIVTSRRLRPDSHVVRPVAIVTG